MQDRELLLPSWAYRVFLPKCSLLMNLQSVHTVAHPLAALPLCSLQCKRQRTASIRPRQEHLRCFASASVADSGDGDFSQGTNRESETNK